MMILNNFQDRSSTIIFVPEYIPQFLEYILFQKFQNFFFFLSIVTRSWWNECAQASGLSRFPTWFPCRACFIEEAALFPGHERGMENAWKCIGGCLERFLLLDFLRHGCTGVFVGALWCKFPSRAIYPRSYIHCITGGWSSGNVLAVSKSLTVFASTANWLTSPGY